MARVEGDTIIIYQGETLDIEFNVVDGDGVAYNLTGGAAVLSYDAAGTVVNVTGTIVTTKVTVSLAHAVTQLLSGRNPFQLMCRNSAGKIVMTREGSIDVYPSLNPDAVSVP